jgi:CRP/FNR family transcriptional regulator
MERGTGCAVDACAMCEARAFSICEALEDHQLQELARTASIVEMPAGRGFVAEGERRTHVFNVTAGAVKLSKLLPDGRTQIVGFLFMGDFIGFDGQEDAGFTAEALTPVRLCRFPRGRFTELLEKYPALERKLLGLASHEIAAAREQMMLLGRKTARERVASFLLGLSRAAERIGLPPNTLHLPMSRAEIADYLGLTTETVSRVFTVLRKEGQISLKGTSNVTLVDPAGLKVLAVGA